MIATWLAGKVSGIVIFCIACLSIVLVPALAIETVRLNGISILGWYAVDGYKPLYEKLLQQQPTLLANNATLKQEVKTCNAHVDSLAKAGQAQTAATQDAVNKAAAAQSSLVQARAALAKIKASNEQCPVADSMLKGAFQ